ncbi:transmembrane protein 104 homolog [Neocloeon triangulifer]|uniref:transmembrane protein 104 homolog n=1 Tax=Neocloeon triangulifer TaxID=2078957 RepID=UPI00286EBC66|nr:transmembrane protein 104 homolog [Neocloeon triangulifer]XP_059477012.1 transmembrane protein 104 homolog [Neocloeon triangulifer]
MPAASEQKYSTGTGLVYIFNLIVGTGALTLPSVFNRAGWAVGVALVLLLAFMSFVTVTFVVESMAAANAVLKWDKLQARASPAQDDAQGEEQPAEEDEPLVEQRDGHTSLAYFCLEQKVELGEMASLFFSKWGRVLFYLCIVVYLYGDLAIYAAAICKSMTDVICTLNVVNGSVNTSVPEWAACWPVEGEEGEAESGGWRTASRMLVYRSLLGAFLLLVGPFAFFNVQKTKYLQMATSAVRWTAFGTMIGLASSRLVADGPQNHPPAAALAGVPALFGACVYSFMCHHSLPGLLTPISDKARLQRWLCLDYVLVAAFYLLLALTGVFAFAHLEDLYTLVFWRPGQPLGYFLALFPVLTLSTTFPVVAVTLRSNLRALAPPALANGPFKGVLALVAVLPPLGVAFMTMDLSVLVGVTGTYAGAGVQYVIPALLVWCARSHSQRLLGVSSSESRAFASPFRGPCWVGAVLLWAAAAVVLVTLNIVEKFEGKIKAAD